jgi:phenylalanyl-tRNA synthetase beta chain
MKCSISWLKEYVPVHLPADELAEVLTMAGLEVETITERFAYLETVIVGRIAEIQPHPNADKLKLCQVDIGDGKPVAVVCGAPNVQPDMLAPLALPGTQLPSGLKIQESVIRGQPSSGMLCSEAELELGADKSGIMGLDPDLKPGASLIAALKLSDSVFEIGLTPNRPDCLSIIGIAREVAALQKCTLTCPEINVPMNGQAIHQQTRVTIEAPAHCPRYTARLIKGVAIGPSPAWLQDRLLSIGLRPINNIVDVTNFVMMEMGQPLHAFDFDQLTDKRIVVRTATQGERFTTLDDKERLLDPEMLMICDGEKPVGIGGVMGGLNSEIEPDTVNVLLESAYFDPVSIRKTSKKLGLSTDASHRFERGVDPDGTLAALNRAAQLMVEVAGGELIEGVIDEHPKKINNPTIEFDIHRANRLLGIDLTQNEMAEYLTALEFRVEPHGPGLLKVTAPSFRVDVSRPEDLVEEIARLSGYDNIPTTYPAVSATGSIPSKLLLEKGRIKRLMTGLDFNEVINYSFIAPSSFDLIQLPQNDFRRQAVKLLNPLTEDQAVMRTSLLPGLLEAIQRNLAQQQHTARLFEIGKVFLNGKADTLPEEVEQLAGLWTGLRQPEAWLTRKEDCDFFDIKGVVESLLGRLHVHGITFTKLPSESCHYLIPGQAARILKGDIVLGQIGAVHPQVLSNYDIKQAVYMFELNLNELTPLVPDELQSAAISKFPSIARDFTIIIDNGIESKRILDCVWQSGEDLIESVHLFDVYEGKPIPTGKKSISFRITYQSLSETLDDETVTPVHNRISDLLLNTFKATLPTE